mmetsp:Transcript_11592/g.27786  ORF Transcript_11592/g.27786 Transcript_11592/m.27786 type:complete len:212 (-) Transcript_11592:247-882(-)
MARMHFNTLTMRSITMFCPSAPSDIGKITNMSTKPAITSIRSNQLATSFTNRVRSISTRNNNSARNTKTKTASKVRKSGETSAKFGPSPMPMSAPTACPSTSSSTNITAEFISTNVPAKTSVQALLRSMNWSIPSKSSAVGFEWARLFFVAAEAWLGLLEIALDSPFGLSMSDKISALSATYSNTSCMASCFSGKAHNSAGFAHNVPPRRA